MHNSLSCKIIEALKSRKLDKHVVPFEKELDKHVVPFENNSALNKELVPFEKELDKNINSDVCGVDKKKEDLEKANVLDFSPNKMEEEKNQKVIRQIKNIRRSVSGSLEKASKDPKFERCVMDVKDKQSDVNPWAVCHASLGKSDSNLHPKVTERLSKFKAIKEKLSTLKKQDIPTASPSMAPTIPVTPNVSTASPAMAPLAKEAK